MSGRILAVPAVAAIAVGVAGAVVALHGHGGDELLRLNQARSLNASEPRALSAADVQTFVARAPEPVAAADRTRLASIHCLPGGGGPLGNPWSCRLRYRSGTRAHYRVTVRQDGYYRGVGSGVIEGCCVPTPRLG